MAGPTSFSRPVRFLMRARVRLRAINGWKLGLLLAFLGAFGALGHAPYHVFPAYVVGIAVLVLALDDTRATARPIRSGFFRAWAFAAGQFLAGTFWVANAFLVSAQDHAWLIWMPLILLPGGLALFWGAAGAVYARLRPRGPARIATFAAIFLATEALRSSVLSGFPWNLPGHVFASGEPISQLASLIGALGLTALTLYACAAPASLFGKGRLLVRAYPVYLASALLAGAGAWGLARLESASVGELDTRVRIVQLDRTQAELRPDEAEDILGEYLELTLSPGLERADLVIWPEGAIPAYIQNEPDMLATLHDALPLGTRVILGAPHVVWGADNQPRFYHNSMHALRVQEEALLVEARYDKARLVPFGEANMVASLTRPFGLETLSQYGVGFDPGTGATRVDLEGLPPFSPLICYEVIYAGYTPDENIRPEWMLNISNDSWYGNSAGPAQLLNQAAYRSIEQGLPLVRSATAGMSGLIDPYGRVVHIGRVGERQVLDLALLASLDEPAFTRFGHAPWLIIFIVFTGLAHVLPRAAQVFTRTVHGSRVAKG